MQTTLSPLQMTLVVGTLFLGGFSKGVTGIGLPTIITPSLAAIYGIQTAVPIVAIITVVTNVLVIGKYNAVWREAARIWPMLVAGLLTTTAGVLVLHRGNRTAMAIILALVAIAYAGMDLLGVRIRLPRGRLRVYGPAMGMVAGFFQGTTGVCGPMVVAYLSSIEDLSRRAYFFALSLAFLVFSLNQVSGYLAFGMYTAELAWMALAAGVPVLCSFYLGIWLQERLDVAKVRIATMVAILAGGLHLLGASIRI